MIVNFLYLSINLLVFGIGITAGCLTGNLLLIFVSVFGVAHYMSARHSKRLVDNSLIKLRQVNRKLGGIADEQLSESRGSDQSSRWGEDLEPS